MNELTNEETELLKVLSQKGALTPLEISVEQLQMPDKVFVQIKELEKKGLISRKHLSSGPEGEVVTLSERGVKTLRGESI